MTEILTRRPAVRIVDSRTFPTGWGSYTCEAAQFLDSNDGQTVTIARLPHLSRFGLFGRAASATQMEAFVGYVATA